MLSNNIVDATAQAQDFACGNLDISRLTFRAMRDIESGLIYFNAPTTGSEIHLPFGGMKASGNGHRELGARAVEEFSETKTVYISYPIKM